MIRLLFIFGTRPEAIKLAPLIKEFKKYSKKYVVRVCVTGQQREMLDQPLKFFKIKPDFDLNLMKPNQTLFDITADGLRGIEGVLNKYLPDIIFVQGDTTTVLVGALSGFYKRVKVAHIEAGLRSFDRFSPFPEEINRKMTSCIADFHFCPTKGAAENLKNEGFRDNIYVVGNTVIDALFLGLEIIKQHGEGKYLKIFKDIDFSRKIILITAHRRESFGKPFEDMCKAMKEIAKLYPEAEIVYPVHLNPNVREPVFRILKGIKNIHLIEPLEYPYFILLESKAHIVLTDSGGVQEEAPALGKPVLVMRDVTERIEGVKAGTAKLVGTNRNKIVKETIKLMNSKTAYNKMSKAVNPYGNGKSCAKVVNIITKSL